MPVLPLSFPSPGLCFLGCSPPSALLWIPAGGGGVVTDWECWSSLPLAFQVRIDTILIQEFEYCEIFAMRLLFPEGDQ